MEDDKPEIITTEDKKRDLLELIRATGARDNDAAAAVGVHRCTVYQWKIKDPAFLAAYNEARSVSLPLLVAEAERRALQGSDRLLEFLLCNYAPDKFRKAQQVDLGNADGKPLKVDDTSAAAERIARILAAAQARKAEAEEFC